MSTAILRDRLDRLLSKVDRSNDWQSRVLVANILDRLPSNLPLKKEILLIDKPTIQSLLGKNKSASKKKYIKELSKYNNREDAFGQICDLVLRISQDLE